MAGWIKLHRAMRKSACYRDSDAKAVWIECLLRANHDEGRVKIGGQTVPIRPGQFLCSRHSLGDDLSISYSKVQRLLKWLESEQQIEQQTTSKYRVITICNWDDYQGDEQQTEPHMDSKWTASGQQVNTNKNVKKNKKDIPPPPLPDWMPVPLWNDYLAMRRKKRAEPTGRAVELLIGKLGTWRERGYDIAAVIEKSITSNWTDLFEPKPEDGQRKGPREVLG